MDEEFAKEVGAAILDGMNSIASFNAPEGFDVDDLKLTWEFNDPRIPEILHGEWVVSIKRGGA